MLCFVMVSIVILSDVASMGNQANRQTDGRMDGLIDGQMDIRLKDRRTE